MTSFDEREKAFEAKYRLDQETTFKVTVRRNKLLGQWAAGEFGLTGADADAYAREVVESDFQQPGDADVVAKILGDFAARGRPMDEERLRKQMERLFALARDQVLQESGKA